MVVIERKNLMSAHELSYYRETRIGTYVCSRQLIERSMRQWRIRLNEGPFAFGGQHENAPDDHLKSIYEDLAVAEAIVIVVSTCKYVRTQQRPADRSSHQH